MFKMENFGGAGREVSYHEARNLVAREANPRANVVRALVLDGRIDVTRLQAALNRLVLRHEALRTRFTKAGDGSYQRSVEAGADARVAYCDCSGDALESPAVRRYLDAVVAKGFGPEDYPLIGTHVVETATRPLFIFTVAEVIADAGSVGLLLRELSGLYLEELGGPAQRLPALEYQLSDFVASHNAWMQTQGYRDAVMKLRDRLHSLIETQGGVQQLLFARQSNEGYSVGKEFPQAFCDKIFALANDMQVSVPTVLIVVSAICVARVRKMPGIFLTSSFSNRHIASLANMVGHLATTVPNHVSLQGDATGLPVKKMHRELFASMAQFGMIPMQEISDEVKKLYPDRPAGMTIKFGKVVADVSMVDEFQLFGLQTNPFMTESVRAEVNEFKFVFRVSGGRIWLQLRGLKETDNHLVADRIVEHLLEETVATL